MKHALNIDWRAFSLPKRGNRSDEYEDAHAGNPTTGRFAVADGATESSFAGKWARLLVEGYVGIEQGKTASHWLGPLRRRWAAEVDHLPLPWYAEEKRDQGAFATFLGLVLCPGETQAGRWKALAIGDSCLFQVRKDRLLAAFPLDRADAFTQQPPLLGSRRPAKTAPEYAGNFTGGRWRPGDRFYLTTDALAQWFLRRYSEGRTPWRSLDRRLSEPKPDAALATYCEQLRDKNELRNDDVTLLALSL